MKIDEYLEEVYQDLERMIELEGIAKQDAEIIKKGRPDLNSTEYDKATDRIKEYHGLAEEYRLIDSETFIEYHKYFVRETKADIESKKKELEGKEKDFSRDIAQRLKGFEQARITYQTNARKQIMDNVRDALRNEFGDDVYSQIELLLDNLH